MTHISAPAPDNEVCQGHTHCTVGDVQEEVLVNYDWQWTKPERERGSEREGV